MTRPLIPDKRLRVRRGLERLGKPLLTASLRFSRLYRPTFHVTSPVLHDVADHVGVYPVIDHYHEPLITPKRHLKATTRAERHLPGIDLGLADQLVLLRSFAFQAELLDISERHVDLVRPYYANLALPPFDAQMLHNVIRHFKPQRIIEVGSGESTRFAMNALRLNAREDPPRPGRLTCIEPFEAGWLEQADVEVVRAKAEDVEPEFFRSLHDGDVLVIDSSHVLRPQGDVLYLFTEVLPTLSAGVLVHVHDIFTPRDYPQQWIEERRLWNEQYLLEALLTHSPRFKVLLAVNHLYHACRAELTAACPAGGDDDREPASFWLKVSE